MLVHQGCVWAGRSEHFPPPPRGGGWGPHAVVSPSKGAFEPTASLARRSVLRTDFLCDARPHGPSPNSLRSPRSLRSNNGDESDSWKRAARAAMSPALPGASDALRSRPGRLLAAPPSHCRSSHAVVVPERTGGRRLSRPRGHRGFELPTARAGPTSDPNRGHDDLLLRPRVPWCG